VGQVLYPAEKDKILISKEGHDLKKEEGDEYITSKVG
jgi:hypothetical protein